MGLVSESTRERLNAARLYAITPDAPPEEIERLVGAWLRGGADVVQLRAKALPRGRLLALARRLRDACARMGALFIVNDHVDVALLVQADGVHLGADDLSLVSARQIAGPEFVIGASASTPEAGRAAEAQGADYLGTGPAYATPIKAEKPVIGPAGVAAVQQVVRIPVFAIGGIESSRIRELRAAGVRRACVIRALAAAEDPESETRQLKEALNE